MTIKNLRTAELKNLFIVAWLLVLTSCSTTVSEPVSYRGSDLPPDNDESADSRNTYSDQITRARIMADMLYEAKIAYEDNRLLLPAGDNAYDRYREVLSFAPDNAVALAGVDEIVVRYVELADAAMQIGQFSNANSLLGRAASINPEHSAIIAGTQRLEGIRNTEREDFTLDPDELSGQSLEIMVTLGEIADYIRLHEATFLINARTDEEGRWIYQTMRQAVGGFRLRGNIGISGEPSILITLPTPAG